MKQKIQNVLLFLVKFIDFLSLGIISFSKYINEIKEHIDHLLYVIITKPLDYIIPRVYFVSRWFYEKLSGKIGITYILNSIFIGILKVYLVFMLLYLLYHILFSSVEFSSIRDIYDNFRILNSILDFTIIVGFLLILKYFFKFLWIIFKYIGTGSMFFLILILNVYYSSYSNLYLDHLNFSTFLSLLLLGIIISLILKVIEREENKYRKQAYYIGAYSKTFEKTIKEVQSGRGKDDIGVEVYYSKYIKNLLKDSFEGKGIKPIIDKPIDNGEDQLGYEKFSTKLYDVIYGLGQESLKHSFSIGIVGKWGVGKTSIVNLLEQEFLYSKSNFKIYKFSPWNYEKGAIVEKFFSELSGLIGNNKISHQVDLYLRLLGEIDKSMSLGSKIYNLFYGGKTIEKLKKEIAESLKQLDCNIIVVIDDIDRCTPNEVMLLLNIIKNLGDFNNMIYVIPYDKIHILKILKDKKIEDQFIDKIVNLEIYIPGPANEQIQKYFKEELSDILKNIGMEKRIIEKVVSSVYTGSLEMENLRFIKKLLNQVNLVLKLNGKNTLKLVEDNLNSIVLLNFMRLKDYLLFNETVKFDNKILKNSYLLSKSDIAPVLLKDLRSKPRGEFKRFFGLFIEKDKKESEKYKVVSHKHSSDKKERENYKNNKKVIQLFT